MTIIRDFYMLLKTVDKTLRNPALIQIVKNSKQISVF